MNSQTVVRLASIGGVLVPPGMGWAQCATSGALSGEVRETTGAGRVWEASPTGKTSPAFGTRIRGVGGDGFTGGATRDVGGTLGETVIGQTIHGSAPGLTSIDGLKLVSVFGGNYRRYNPSDLYTQEVVVELGGGSAEAWSGGCDHQRG